MFSIRSQLHGDSLKFGFIIYCSNLLRNYLYVSCACNTSRISSWKTRVFSTFFSSLRTLSSCHSLVIETLEKVGGKWYVDLCCQDHGFVSG
jgi:hypothetical protein